MAIEAFQRHQASDVPQTSFPKGESLAETKPVNGIAALSKTDTSPTTDIPLVTSNPLPDADDRSAPTHIQGARTARGGRLATASVAAVLALSQAACAADADTQRPPAADTATITGATETPTATPGIITVETVLPEELPDAVAAQVDTAVDIGERQALEEWQTPDGQYAGSVHREGSIGSGAYIGDGEVLTAGHVRDESPDLLCGDFTVTNHVPADGGIYDKPILGESSTYVSDDNADAYSHPDFGVMNVDPVAFEGVEPPEIRTTPLEVGEPVYAINYQPDRDGTDRSPIAREPHDTPAIYGGIVVGTTGAFVEVATALQSYGEFPDSSSRKGASGGGWYDADGNLVGVTSRASEEATLDPVRAFGVDLPGEGTVSLSYVQPITPDLLAAARNEIAENPDCPKSEPTIVIIE
jgi:hypothetical protein